MAKSQEPKGPPCDLFPETGLVKQYEPYIRKWVGNFCEGNPEASYDETLRKAIAIAWEVEQRFKHELGYDFTTPLRYALKALYKSDEMRAPLMTRAEYAREKALDNPPMPELKLGNRQRIVFDLNWTILKKLFNDIVNYVIHPNHASDNAPSPIESRHRVVAGVLLLPGDDVMGAYQRISDNIRIPLEDRRPSQKLAGWIRAIVDHLVRRQREADQEAANQLRGDYSPVFFDALPRAVVKFCQPKRPFRVLKRNEAVLSLDTPVGEGEDGKLTLHDVIAAPEPSSDEEGQHRILKEAAEAIRSSLSPIEAKVGDALLARLDRLDQLKSRGILADVAKEIGVTRGAVSKARDRFAQKVVGWIGAHK